jgi:hypothetical protein
MIPIISCREVDDKTWKSGGHDPHVDCKGNHKLKCERVEIGVKYFCTNVKGNDVLHEKVDVFVCGKG